ncbi:MAG: type II secretion system minor pseudopilin GspJ [Gammaproteobacteria bacterium]
MRRNSGFTLLELLVAMAIVAVIGVLALGGLNQVIIQQTIAQERAERWREIQFAMRIITQDLAQLHPRPMREEFGESWVPSVVVDPSAPYDFELSRGGWANPVGSPRGTVLRVAYLAEDDVLVRFNWSVMDRTTATPPIRTELLTGVENVEILMFDGSGQEHTIWPPLSVTGADSLFMRPRRIDFRVNLEDFGWVWRSLETGG